MQHTVSTTTTHSAHHHHHNDHDAENRAHAGDEPMVDISVLQGVSLPFAPPGPPHDPQHQHLVGVDSLTAVDGGVESANNQHTEAGDVNHHHHHGGSPKGSSSSSTQDGSPPDSTHSDHSSPQHHSRTRSAPSTPDGEPEERDKKRQRRLLQNRQSAALSRQRKKEYLNNMERQNNELNAENKVLKQTVYNSDNRIRELESRLAFFIKQNEDLKSLLRTSDKVDEMNRLLAQAYSSLALQTAGINIPGLVGFHQQQEGSSAPAPAPATTTTTTSPSATLSGAHAGKTSETKATAIDDNASTPDHHQQQ